MVKYFNEYAFACMDSTMHSIFNIQKYPVGGGFKVWHSERGIDKEYLYRHLVWMTFLTDNPAGGTEFIYQDKYIAAEKGKTLIWPSDWTHTHRGKVDTTKEKIGKYSPGMHIPIVSMQYFYKNLPDTAILLAWNHKKEIFKKERN